MRWLNAHWRAASVICLHFTGYPEDEDWEVGHLAPASTASRACALRVTCGDPVSGERGAWARAGLAGLGPPLKLLEWVAGILPLCQNLTALHLRRIEITQLPALPLLVHLILQECVFRPALVASIQGLARLETLHVSGVSGQWASEEPPDWDVRACTRLRRLYMGYVLAHHMVLYGQDLNVPPACAVALSIKQMGFWEEMRGWIVRLGGRLADLRLEFDSADVAMWDTSFLHAPELGQLRHVTLAADRTESPPPYSLCVSHLLSGLPRCVESLHLDYPILLSEQAVVMVPASLRALRVKGVCDEPGCSQGCRCYPSERSQDLTFGLHVGLERLCLVLWGVRVGLQCLDARAPAGLHELNVQAQVLDMDYHLAVEVEQRGRVLEGCEAIDPEWEATGSVVPPVQVAFIGRGPVHMEYRRSGLGRVRHWACTCGTCAECLGPDTLSVDAHA